MLDISTTELLDTTGKSEIAKKLILAKQETSEPFRIKAAISSKT